MLSNKINMQQQKNNIPNTILNISLFIIVHMLLNKLNNKSILHVSETEQIVFTCISMGQVDSDYKPFRIRPKFRNEFIIANCRYMRLQRCRQRLHFTGKFWVSKSCHILTNTRNPHQCLDYLKCNSAEHYLYFITIGETLIYYYTPG